MIPPSYADLGKKARDLFSKGYNYGFFKIDGKTKANAGVEFSITGSSNHENGKLAGNLESKYKWAEYGLTLTEKWTTESNLETGLSVEDQLVDGLKLTLDTQFSPRSGRKGGQVKSEYKREYLHTNFDVDFDSAGPTLSGAAVAGHLGWLIGGQFTFDTSKNTLTRNNVAVGYVADEFALHANVNDGTEFSGSVYHSIHRDLEFGVQFSWSAGANVSRFAVGTRYSPDFQTTYRAKVNNACQVGLSYQHKVRPGLALTLSALVEAKTFNQGGHKIGLGLELE